MHQTVVSARANRDTHVAVSAPSPSPVCGYIALQGGGLSSLQHAFERLEGGVDPSDHLESSDKVKMDPSTITELQIPLVWWCYCSWRIPRHRIAKVVFKAASFGVFVSAPRRGPLHSFLPRYLGTLQHSAMETQVEQATQEASHARLIV